MPKPSSFLLSEGERNRAKLEEVAKAKAASPSQPNDNGRPNNTPQTPQTPQAPAY